jgi:hypothetical protein
MLPALRTTLSRLTSHTGLPLQALPPQGRQRCPCHTQPQQRRDGCVCAPQRSAWPPSSMPPKKMKPIKWDSPEGAGRAGWQWGPAAPLPIARLPERANGAEELLKAQITELKQEIAMKDAAFNALLIAKDAEIRRLHADLARSCAAAGAAAQPAHVRAADSDGVATSASVPPQLQSAAVPAAPVAAASLPLTTSQLRVKPVRGTAHAPKAETSAVSASKRPRNPVPAALFNKFKFPEFCDFDSEGNIVVSDHNNHCVQVLRYSDGAILRSFGRAGKAGDGAVSLCNPCAFAIAHQGL